MKFPEKLWTIVNECVSDAIGWGKDGTTIFIDYVKFEKEFLGEHSGVFKTKNIVSFVRQLNLYGFRKCGRFGEVHEFQNHNFIRGEEHFLKFMRRKIRQALDTFPTDEKAGKENFESFKIKNCILRRKRSSKLPVSPLAPLSFSSYPFSSFQELGLSPDSWWSSNNPSNPTETPFAKDKQVVSNASNDQDVAKPRIDENSSWDSNDYRRNIIFVQVPYFGLYPGFFNGNLPLPITMPHQDEVQNCGFALENSFRR